MKNKTILSFLFFLAILAVVFFIPQTSEAAMQWSQANLDGFEDNNNTRITSATVFNNQLYVGTYNTTTGTEVWRTSDGISWSQSNTDGFDEDINNTTSYSMTVFNNQLYLGTYNTTTGTEVWRTSDGTTWSQANTDGFGDGGNNEGSFSMIVFSNQLYVGTTNTIAGAEVWRTSDGTTWSPANTNGFGGGISNVDCYALTIFNNQLYVGTGTASIGKVFRYSGSGTTWSQVNTNDFGDSTNGGVNQMEVFNNQLYAGVYNLNGTEVWRTSDGTAWSQVNTDGFDGDGININYMSESMTVFNNQLYVGARNFTASEVWRTSDGIAWSQANIDGFGDVGNLMSGSSTVFNNQLYVGTGKGVGGGEVWAFSDITNPTISNQNPVAFATGAGINTNIYLEVDDVDLGIDSSTLNVTIEGDAAITDGSCQAGFSCTIVSDGSGGYDITINPDTNFNYNQEVNVSTSVSDLGGNNNTSSFWFFTTETDDLNPTITSQSPANNATDIAIGSNLSFIAQDSESGINSSTINVTIEGDSAISSGSCQRGYYCTIEENISGGYDVMIDPNSDFPYEREINVSATVQDNAANSLTSTWSFTTEDQPSLEPTEPTEPTLSPKILTTSGPGETTRLWAYDRQGNTTNAKINQGLFPDSYLGGAGIFSIDQNHNGLKDQFVIFALSEGGPQARVMGLKEDGSTALKGQMFLFQNPDDAQNTSSIRDGLSMVSGDFDNDGYEDDVAACLTGDYNPHVKIFKDASGIDNWELINQFDAPFGANGCNLGTFQYDSGATELLVTPHHGPSVDPIVYIYTVGGTLKKQFQAYDDPINQGLTASGINDRIYTTPNNGSSHVRAFDKEGTPKNFWWAYQEHVRGNFRNVSGDIDLDGKDEILISPVGSNGPQVLAFEPTGEWRSWPNFFAFNDKSLRNGVGIAVIDNWHGVN
jgi:hypothetical protein